MEIKAYSKKELAVAYGQNMSMSGALNRLREWICGNPELMEALKRTGYDPQKKTHLFTRYQVALIFEYLGEP